MFNLLIFRLFDWKATFQRAIIFSLESCRTFGSWLSRKLRPLRRTNPTGIFGSAGIYGRVSGFKIVPQPSVRSFFILLTNISHFDFNTIFIYYTRFFLSINNPHLQVWESNGNIIENTLFTAFPKRYVISLWIKAFKNATFMSFNILLWFFVIRTP